MEAQITAQLQHPNIVPVYSMVEKEADVGYAMKLIHGRTLKDFIEGAKAQLDKKEKPDEAHSLQALLDHFLKVCDAMHYAHRKGVVHRDLKPLNIMVGPYNEVYVMDWGIAKLVNVDHDTFSDNTERVDSKRREKDDEDQTTVGELLGTPIYMSPEQANGNNDTLDHRSDIFTLGIILYELITLTRALAGGGQRATLERARIAKLRPPVPYSNLLHVPNQLFAIVKKATQAIPDDRYDTVEEFANDIRRYLRGDAVSARPDNLKHKIIRWMNKHRIATLNIVMYSILASIVITSWSLYNQQEGKIEAQEQGHRESEFISAVSIQAQIIDAQFLEYKGILIGIASAVVSLLESGKADPGPYYDYKQFNSKEHGAPDLAPSTLYGTPISVNWSVYKLAPNIEYENVEKTVRALIPLRYAFKRMMLSSHHSLDSIDDDKAVKELILSEGLPIVWANVGLENGIFTSYPGSHDLPDDYDHRNRPWYVNTLKNDSSCWLAPYLDVGGRGILLPCGSRLIDKNGKLLGVAVVEITLDFIQRELMSMPGTSGLQTTYLLNNRGEIIIDSSAMSNEKNSATFANSINDLVTFSNKLVVDDILQKKSGFVNYTENGIKKIIAYGRLNSIGWYYVAEANANEFSMNTGNLH